MFRTARRTWSVVAATAALAGLTALPAAPAAAEPEKPEVPIGTRLAARTNPSVQLTSLTFTGEVVVPVAELKSGPLKDLQAEMVRMALNGKIAQDEKSLVKYMLQRMASNVGRFLRPGGQERTVQAEVGGLCTGWWVTPDGYMVTGAHCVQLGEEELSRAFAKQALDKFNKEDTREFVKGFKNMALDEEMLKLGAQMFAEFNASHMKIRGLKKDLSVLQSLPGGGVDKTAKAVPAEIVSVGENYPGKDFALLKVNGQQNLPTVPLGDDPDVQVGDVLYISGFPGLITNTAFFSLESKLDPALTEGPYNAKRTTQTGVPYIQAQAPSYRGNSGGPVFSRQGKVVGMLIAGSVDQSTGESAENHSFVLPVSIVKEKLNEKNVKPAESVTTKTYDAALDAFFQRHYKIALPLFREVQALYPNHPYVARYISDSQQAITAGKDETPLPMGVWIGVAAGAVVLVVAGVLVFVLLRRRRARRAAAGPAYPAQPGVPGAPAAPAAPAGPGAPGGVPAGPAYPAYAEAAVPAADPSAGPYPGHQTDPYGRPAEPYGHQAGGHGGHGGHGARPGLAGQVPPQRPGAPEPHPRIPAPGFVDRDGDGRDDRVQQLEDLEQELAQLRRQLDRRPPAE
ncbi:trypsin-like peptidase domain-containing protein [Bailinhaonella thermotolerans]|nr:trypsin-like peptidase domain-containing protein [Bailinhaonella thermotolerans]